MMRLSTVLAIAGLSLCVMGRPLPAIAQVRPAPVAQVPQVAAARLLITVVDATGAVLPSATVTVVALDPPAAAAAIASAVASPQGLATLANLVPGRYSVRAEFPGLETNTLKDVRLRAGDNRRVVVLALPRLQSSVTVSVDQQVVAASRTATFGTALTRDQLDALSDDPDDLRRQLLEIAGIDAVIRVDTFEGAALPPKAQIKSIHVTRDAFAAENRGAGGLFVDIVTQPGIGPLRGGLTGRFRDGSLNARSPFAPTKGPERTQTYTFNVGGTIKPDVSSFSVSVSGTRAYDTPILRAALPNGTVSEALGRRVPQDNMQVAGLLDYALTKDQTLRLYINGSRSTSSNRGVGAYDLPERAYASTNTFGSVVAQEVGPLGRRSFINTRANIGWSTSSSASAVDAPTIIVTDAFTSGGQQRAGARRTLRVNVASDLDYIRGIHSFRTGIQLFPEWFRSDDRTNYLGTYTFESLAAYEAGTPRGYTRRIGDPNLSSFDMQSGIYVQDDIRVRRSLTLSPGLRFDAVSYVPQKIAPAPRFGITWAPFRSGRTTLRASAGIFYTNLGSGSYEESLRLDGFRQREINILNPAYDPLTLDPGSTGAIPPVNRYLMADDLDFAKYKRLSAGINQTLGARLRVSAIYAYFRASSRWRGENVNVPVDGVRPDPAFANMIVEVSDGHSIQHTLSTNFSLNLARAGSPGAPGRPAATSRFDWRRMSVNGSYSYGRDLTNADAASDGIFATPANGVEAEWGPTGADVRHRVNVGLTSTALRNLNANLSLNAASAPPYNITTGFDDNGDGIFNDRPAGAGHNSGRGSEQWTLNGNFSYAIPLGRSTVALPPGVAVNAPGGAAPRTVTVTSNNQGSRYRLQLTASIQNITNHNNYGGHSGTMTSPFFGRPQRVLNPRRFDFGMGVTF